MSVSEADVLSLSASYDIITIGMRADEARRQRHGTRTTFVRVASVDVTPGAPIGVSPVAGEVRITGTPASRASALDRVKEVAAVAGRTPLSGFSLADLEQLAATEQITLRALLEDLQAAGLELVADAPYDALRDPRRSIEEVNIGGLALARLTFHRLPAADSVSVLKEIAALQRVVGVIRAFAPLPRKVNPLAPTTGYDDVKRIALARLVVDNVPSIQVDWSLYGPKLAQVALTVGADDLDGVSIEEDTGEGSRRTPLEEVRRNIRAAGLEPVERNGRFDPVGR
jgi:aminodeoxyfutalosine synthase